MTYPDRKDR
ncbi:Protein of unknown function [Propionibacterium freudenreichii]|nr:Protein of unknown function [Propionibacterium freudenreichii]CEG91818.1 Protein of unknown function [Propionibacterium freudenreichii]CEG93788.1 Protein of unknown function [Propionibacterium freudenreichii]CEG98667.1 Protein of unknown function [Propionibacterium freudenreichii]CEG99757.1 Protein of unknown function [Propionibacterium freudenreichii]